MGAGRERLRGDSTEPAILLGLDLLAAALSLVLVAFFARSWLRHADGSLLLLAIGFLLLAISYPAISASHLDPDLSVGPWDTLRLVGQTGGSLCLVLAYALRAPRTHTLRFAGVALALGAAGVALAALLLRAPDGGVPLRPLLLGAHALQVIGLLACAAGASRGWRASRTLGRALPPAGFAVLAAGKTLWLALTLTTTDALVAAIYAARFAGLVLLLLALALPAGALARRARAEGAA